MRYPRVCLTLISALAIPLAIAQSPRPVAITVHADQPTGPYTPLWNFFGADEPNYLYAPNGQKLLGELSALSPVPVYFRPHNLFTTGNGDGSLKWGSTNVYTERPDGTPIYDFTLTDRIFDALIAAHVRPLVEIGFMPQALSIHPEPYRHTFPKGDIYTGWAYPPKDYAKWGKLVEAYAAHLKQRYGAISDNNVDTWMWEIWNEPDIGYWHGTPEEYDHLYDVSAQAIRTVLPHARIGGPESTGVGSSHAEAFLRQFLEHCAHGVNAATGETGAPLDFISYHPKGRPSSVDGPNGRYVRMDIGIQLRAIERGMHIIASYPEWKNTPIVLGESDPEGCAACQGKQNGYRNGPLYGVSEVESTIRTYQMAQKYGLKVEGAVTWAFEFEDQPPFAGFRELATNGIDKPVLNAFRMMGMLGGNWVRTESSGAVSLDDIAQTSVQGQPDINAVATRQNFAPSHPQELDILVWNYHDDDLPVPATPIQLKVDGLASSSTVSAEEFRMDATHSNAYAVFQQMGSPQQLTPAQLHQLQQAGALEQTVAPHPIPVTSGSAILNLDLLRQGVALIRLRWQPAQ
jgi:xylan 1,4-beta-xylosidase